MFNKRAQCIEPVGASGASVALQVHGDTIFQLFRFQKMLDAWLDVYRLPHKNYVI
jgi:gamma-glutamyltranspeptidase